MFLKQEPKKLSPLKSLKNSKSPWHQYRAFSLLQPSELVPLFEILGGTTVKNVQIDPQTTKIWFKQAKYDCVSE